MKIDKRKKYGIMLDTETANGIIEEDGTVNLMFSLPYDFGFAVIDTRGNVYEKYSYVNSDIFCDEKELMSTAYYSEKMPQYWEDIKQGKRILCNTYSIRTIIHSLIKKYNCKFVCCHNASFDYRACNNIQRWMTKSKYRYFFPKHIEVWDTLKMARDVIATRKDYQEFCLANGFMTKHSKPRPRLTAEVLYRFITNNLDFEESHTGLEDVEIEIEIFKYCQKQHKSMRKKLWEN